MIPLQTVALGCLAACVGGYAYAFVWRRLGRRLGLGEQKIDGTERWNLFACSFAELVQLALTFAAFRASGLGFEAWHAQPWNEGAQGQELEMLWFFLYIGCMVKDFFAGITPIIIAHHFFCVLGCVIFMFASPPGLFLLSVSAMEQGSAVYNMWCLYPENKALTAVDAIVMTFTNIVGTWASYRLHVAEVAPTFVQYFCPTVMMLLVIERQRALFSRSQQREKLVNASKEWSGAKSGKDA